MQFWKTERFSTKPSFKISAHCFCNPVGSGSLNFESTLHSYVPIKGINLKVLNKSNKTFCTILHFLSLLITFYLKT